MTEEELRNWIRLVANRYIIEDTSRQWEGHDTKDGTLTWDDYKKRTYGYIDSELVLKLFLFLLF